MKRSLLVAIAAFTFAAPVLHAAPPGEALWSLDTGG